MVRYIVEIYEIIFLGIQADETFTLKKEPIKPVEYKPIHPIDEQFEIFKRLEERKLVDHNTASISDKRPKHDHEYPFKYSNINSMLFNYQNSFLVIWKQSVISVMLITFGSKKNILYQVATSNTKIFNKGLIIYYGEIYGWNL